MWDKIIELMNSLAVLHENWAKGTINEAEYYLKNAEIKRALKELKDRVQFNVEGQREFEKTIGGRRDIEYIGWLREALKRAMIVCKIELKDNPKDSGTGFLLAGGFVLTNHHVICRHYPNHHDDCKLDCKNPPFSCPKRARLIFDYELGKHPKTYDVEPTHTYLVSKDLDYTLLKVKDKPNDPLAQWGYAKFEDFWEVKENTLVNIIHHPNGDMKSISMPKEIIRKWPKKNYLFYEADTDPGSSGSPVFNQQWNVIALHHAGKLIKEGGMQIDAKGTIRDANRGILIDAILKDLEEKDFTIKQEASNGTQESTALPHYLPDLPPAPLSDHGKKISQEVFNRYYIYSIGDAFINRQEVKRAFRWMLNKHKFSKSVLIIKGAPGSGLTHVQSYIADVIEGIDKYQLVRIVYDEEGERPDKVYGADIANDISKVLGLDYKVEVEDKKSVLKLTTFFTKLKEWEENARIPIISLDGLHRVTTPSLNKFAHDLLDEALSSKKFYVILTVPIHKIIHRKWSKRIRSLSPITIGSFKREEVRKFVNDAYSYYYKKTGEALEYTPKVFTENWMTRNESNFTFDDETLNVEDIGEFCTNWYNDFSLEIEKALDEA